MKHTTLLTAYIETALWSSVDETGNALDQNYTIDDIDAETLMHCRLDCEAFLLKAAEYLPLDTDLDQVMHDFWLTRNRHGAGFWDGDYDDDIGEMLTKFSHEFGEVDLVVGDDGKLYI